MTLPLTQEKTENLSNAEPKVSSAVQTEVTDAVQNERKEYLLYHFNHIGSTTAVTDEKGAVKYTYTYSIYGELLSGNYGEVDYLYNGQYGVTSDDNGLYYMRARYYNIDIKRFINQDILTGSIDSSQSLNRYAYVEGNSVNFLDPFGLDEYRVDTSTAHTVLGVIGAAAYIVGGIATIVNPVVGVVGAVSYAVGAIASGVNAGLYINDAIEADSSEERRKNINSASINILTIFTGAAAGITSFGVWDDLSSIIDAIVNGISANWGQWDDI